MRFTEQMPVMYPHPINIHSKTRASYIPPTIPKATDQVAKIKAQRKNRRNRNRAPCRICSSRRQRVRKTSVWFRPRAHSVAVRDCPRKSTLMQTLRWSRLTYLLNRRIGIFTQICKGRKESYIQGTIYWYEPCILFLTINRSKKRNKTVSSSLRPSQTDSSIVLQQFTVVFKYHFNIIERRWCVSKGREGNYSRLELALHKVQFAVACSSPEMSCLLV